mmetsp:Transcript_8/g.20  ORF Transcript_8/g.20 Transcript_8/m.20 type:complete len:219 (+) Transcript_8:404-1060(+)
MVVPTSIALAHSWMRSAACRPTMCTPSTLRDFLLNITLATPSPDASASAFELARKLPMPMPSSKPCCSARALAAASSSPTKAISGCVKQAAGMASWLTTCLEPAMFSTAEMPWADAACASIITPFASPMQYKCGTTLPPFLSSTCIRSFTCTKPRSVSTPHASSPRLFVKGTRPVATMHASTSRVSTCSLVPASIILIRTGFSPGTPGVTSAANTPVR